MITAQERIQDKWWEEVDKRFHCDHEEQKLVRYQQSNGSWRIRRQCLNCGEWTTSDLPQRNVSVMSLPVVDKETKENYRQARSAAKDEAREEHLKQFAAPAYQQRQEKYEAYLASEHWKALRLAVLNRDSYRCQNCFCQVTSYTSHVHHLSYVGLERVGKSFAFECVTLCPKCHIEFHSRMQYGY